MTELEQRLLDELEGLEQDRSKKDESFKTLKENYEKSIRDLSKTLTEKYQNSLTLLMKDESKEQESLLEYLKTLSTQQAKIIELLEEPPTGDSFKKVLEEALTNFSDNLISSLSESNNQLLEGINTSLENLQKEQ